MDIIVVTHPDQFQCKIRKIRCFSATDGQSSVTPKIPFVPRDTVKNLFDRIIFSKYIHCRCLTYFRAGKTVIALTPVHNCQMFLWIHVDCLLRTDRHAFPAAIAVLLCKPKLRIGLLPFRITAPYTIQRTAF